MENIFGGLLEFESTEQFEKYLDEITPKDALKLIELCIMYIQQNGGLTIEESHSMYVCLKKLKKNQ